jgi:hypothetical protein
MGEGSEWIAASGWGENNGLDTCEARHVRISPQEDCGGTAGEMGEGEGCAEEGGVKYGTRIKPRYFGGGPFSLEKNHSDLDDR